MSGRKKEVTKHPNGQIKTISKTKKSFKSFREQHEDGSFGMKMETLNGELKFFMDETGWTMRTPKGSLLHVFVGEPYEA